MNAFLTKSPFRQETKIKYPKSYYGKDPVKKAEYEKQRTKWRETDKMYKHFTGPIMETIHPKTATDVALMALPIVGVLKKIPGVKWLAKKTGLSGLIKKAKGKLFPKTKIKPKPIFKNVLLYQKDCPDIYTIH